MDFGDDEDNMKLKIKVQNGKFETATQSLKLIFDNNEMNATNLRNILGIGEMDSAVTFTIKCLDGVKQEDLDDFQDFLTALVKTSGMLEESDAPISAITPLVTDGLMYGEKFFRITCPLKAELSGMSAGVIQAAGVNHVEMELKVDENNQAAYFSVDLNVSRNAIELAQEMAGLPAELASFAQMYNESDMSFKFKSWTQMAGNPIIGEIIPNEMKDECEAILSGSTGFDPLAVKLATLTLQELVVNDSNGTFGPFFAKAMACFLEVVDVQFVVGNALFKCDVFAPGLIQKFNVPVPETPNTEEEIDASNYPSTYTLPLHEHELVLHTGLYGGMGYACEKCGEFGKGHGYHCDICQYDLHPKCALDQ